MNHNLDESQKLDQFNANREGERNRNQFFAKERGGFNSGNRGNDRGRGRIESRFINDRGGRQFGYNKDIEDNKYFDNNEKGRDFGKNRRNFEFRDNRERDFGANKGRDFGGERGDFGGIRRGDFGGDRRGGFGGERRGFGDRRGGFGGERRGFGDRRGDFGGKIRYGERRGDFGGRRRYGDRRGDFGGRNYEGYNKPFYHDDMGRDYNEMEINFNRGRNSEENDEEYQMKKEAQFEREKFLVDFKKDHKEIIESFKVLFINEHLKDEQIYQIIKNIKSSPRLTIFEAMNYIYREIQIIKTLEYVNSDNNREYGPNKDDIFEYVYEEYYPKKYLNEVIQKYKIYESGIENSQTNVLEKYWVYKDDFDKRRKLLKDESSYFNYLPILNPNDKNNGSEDDVYAKNENELLYHYLYYKTLMCKQCDLTDENNQENELCPYSHNILKDFRIIYDYKNEYICAFMKKLLESNLFSFTDYLNYIPMSLSSEFNLDTFKVHKCQLDKNCPNDYHLCPYYHKSEINDGERRPLSLFSYSGNTGDICFDDRRRRYCPEKCICGIFCNFLHSKNEYNYHPEHFRKEYKCQRDKIRGKCIYEKTCYAKHSYSSDEEEMEGEEDDEEINEEDIEENENISDTKKKVNNLFTVAKTMRCRKCQNVAENGELAFFRDCSHFICIKCFKRISFGSNKKKKKNKEKDSFVLQCPFCEKELAKGSLVNASFKSSINKN